MDAVEVKDCYENESICTEAIDIKGTGMNRAEEETMQVSETPFDEMSASQQFNQFDLDTPDISVTSMVESQAVQLPDGTFGIIKHLAQYSDGFQFVSLEDGTLAWLATGMFHADTSSSTDQLEFDTIDARVETATLDEEIEDRGDIVVHDLPVDNAGHAVSLDETTGHLISSANKSHCRNNGRLHSTNQFLSSERFDKTFKCLYEGCGRLYTTQHHLRVHQRSHTGDRPYICCFDGCDKAFSTGYGLKSHSRIHTGEKPYICTQDGCEKAFKTSGDLQKHTRTHTGEKPFQCPYEDCKRSFTTSNIRKVHVRTHTGERPYTCDVVGCAKTFASATNYKNHIRIHSGEKPYVCTYDGCGKRFTEYSSLYKHHVVHTPSKPYECSDCGKTYRQTSTLAIHRRMAHGDSLHAESTTLVQSTTTAYLLPENQSDDGRFNKQRKMFSLTLINDGVRIPSTEDNDGNLIIDTSDRQNDILSSTSEGIQILSSANDNVAMDAVILMGSSAKTSSHDFLGAQAINGPRVYVITNPLQCDSLALQVSK